MTLTKRLVKGSALTHSELDANFDHGLDRANHTGEQAISTVTGLQAALDAKAASSALATVATTGAYSDLSGTPTIVDWTTDQGATNIHSGNIPDLSATYAAASHVHTMSEITDAGALATADTVDLQFDTIGLLQIASVAPGTPTAGQVPAVNATLDELEWTTPAGGGNVSNTGTPVDNQFAVWTGSTTLEGISTLTWNGTVFGIGADVLPATDSTHSLGSSTFAFADIFADQITIGGTVIDGTTLADPGADRLLGWDDSAAAGSEVSYFTVGTGLAITGTTLAVSGVVQSDTSGASGSDAVTNVVSLTTAEYGAITPDASTLYLITDAA